MSQRQRGLITRPSPLARSNENIPVPSPDPPSDSLPSQNTTTARRRGRPPRAARNVPALSRNSSRSPSRSNRSPETTDNSAQDAGALGPAIVVKQEPVEIKTEVDIDTHSAGESAAECAVCLQAYVHPVKLPCNHVFCYLCVKGFALHGCAICRRPIPEDFIEKPVLVDATQLEKPVVFDEGYLWFYEGRNGWWQFDERTGQELETFFKLNIPEIEILIASQLYTIDLRGFKQYRTSEPWKRRRIKRDHATVPKKGWWQYDERTSLELENSFKRSQRTCDLLIAGYLYTVDFNAMLQYRKGDPLRRRRIKRDFFSIPKKGVAGIRVARETPNADTSDVPITLTATHSDALLSPAVTPHAPSNTPQTPQTPPSPPSPSPPPPSQPLQPRFQRLHEAIEETRRWSEREARCLRRAIEEIERMRLQDGVQDELVTPPAHFENCPNATTFYNMDSEPEESEHPWTSSEEEV